MNMCPAPAGEVEADSKDDNRSCQCDPYSDRQTENKGVFVSAIFW